MDFFAYASALALDHAKAVKIEKLGLTRKQIEEESLETIDGWVKDAEDEHYNSLETL